MFTSRAEFRLNLRIDNADERLTPIARRIGLITDAHWDQYLERKARIQRVRQVLEGARAAAAHSFFVSRGIDLRERPTFVALLRRPEIRLQDLIEEGVLEIEPLLREEIIALETDIKYEGYLKQQNREVERLRNAESRRLPPDLDYANMPGLSREIIEKLTHIQPHSIGQASRIPGITPAAISILLLHLEMRRQSRKVDTAV